MADENAAVEEHKTSLAVWDLDSPLVVGRPGKMKVGAKCSAGCPLTDHEIEIFDENGSKVVRAALSATPWPGTSGLYWVELNFCAPKLAGSQTWTVTSAHGDAFSHFTFVTVQPPEHTLTVRIRDKEGRVPLREAEIRLGPYRASSDEKGSATIDVPKGSYSLSVWKVGYEHFSMVIEVADSMSVDVMVPVEVEPEEKYWM
jgi:hypothetical protein